MCVYNYTKYLYQCGIEDGLSKRNKTCFACSKEYSETIEFCLPLFFFFGHTTWHVGLSLPGIEHVPPEVKRQSLNNWSTREVPVCLLKVRHFKLETYQKGDILSLE